MRTKLVSGPVQDLHASAHLVGVEDSMDSKEEEEGSDTGGFGSVPGSSLTSYHGICVRITTHNYN